MTSIVYGTDGDSRIGRDLVTLVSVQGRKKIAELQSSTKSGWKIYTRTPPPPYSHSNQGCKTGQFLLLRGFILDLGGGGGEGGLQPANSRRISGRCFSSFWRRPEKRRPEMRLLFAGQGVCPRQEVEFQCPNDSSSPPPPQKTPKVHPPGMFVLPFFFSYFVSFVIAFPQHHVSLPAIYILNMDEQCQIKNSTITTSFDGTYNS